MDNGRLLHQNQRFILNFLISSNIIMLMFYCALKNPLEYSMSMIGNRTEIINLFYFISWSVFFAGSTYYILKTIYDLMNFNNKLSYTTLRLACITLIITALVPAKLTMPTIRAIHIGLSVLHVLLFAISFHPFITKVVKGRKYTNTLIILWMAITWPGSIIILLIVGWNAIYQISYFINVLLILMVITNIVLNRLNNKTQTYLLKEETQ